MPAAQHVIDQTASPRSVAAGLTEKLETARRVIEAKFVSAGDVLSEAVDGIGALIAALDDLTGALDPAAISTTVKDLQGAADKLTALPSNHHARRAVVADLNRHRAELGASLLEMRQSLAYLRAFTMNMKITAGGIVQADAEFTRFAGEISTRIEAGSSELDGLQRELDALEEPVGAVCRQGEAMSERCGKLIPLVPDELNASADLIASHQTMIGMAATSSAGLAREIRSKVGRTLGALQIGDITRQRIEHVQYGLALIDRMRGEGSAERFARTAPLVQTLLAAQLDDAMQGFEREVGHIGVSMEGLASNADALLKLRDLAYGQENGAKAGLLHKVETRLTQAVALVEEIEAAERDVLATAQTTAEAARIVASRLAAIQVMKSDVHYMAFNTTLKASRIGDAGRPLAAIAVELRIQASNLEQAANRSLVILEALIAAAAQLTDEGRDGREGGETTRFAAREANLALSGAAQRIATASARTDSDLLRLAERGEAVLAVLNRSSGRFGLQEEIGHALNEVAADLAASAEDAQPCDADIRDAVTAALATLYATYTMDQERSVHLAFTQAWEIASAPEPSAVATASSDDLEDALF